MVAKLSASLNLQSIIKRRLDIIMTIQQEILTLVSKKEDHHINKKMKDIEKRFRLYFIPFRRTNNISKNYND
jgi:hypothetical protein